jgi:hypothetical protein
MLAIVIAMFGYMAPTFRFVLAVYQFFLIGICVGVLMASTVGLIIERSEWNHYRMFFYTVMISVLVLVVVNCIIFRVLGGEQFVRNLVSDFWAVFSHS